MPRCPYAIGLLMQMRMHRIYTSKAQRPNPGRAEKA
jgi:hypothetical protein